MTRGELKPGLLRIVTALTIAATLFAMRSTAANAAKPAPPPPAGTIYYRSGDVYYGIKADGTGLVQNLLPNWSSLNPYFSGAAAMNPCNLPVGSDSTQDRWWLTTLQTGTYDEVIGLDGTSSFNGTHRDLFAVRTNPANRSQLITVQLTDLFGVAQITAFSGWSNDSNEDSTSYIAATALNISSSFIADENGTFYDAREQVPCTVRLPLRGSDISNPAFVPAGPDTMTPAELDSLFFPSMTVAGSFSYMNSPQGVLSPDGLDYVLSDPSTPPDSTTPQRLVIADALSEYPANSFVLWDGSAAAPRNPTYAEWSPNGQNIAFIGASWSNGGTGDLWIVSSSGGAPTKLLGVTTKGLSTFTYTNPVWSPDSNHVAVFKLEFRSGSVVRQSLVRVAVSNGSVTELTQVPFQPYVLRSPLRWTRNN